MRSYKRSYNDVCLHKSSSYYDDVIQKSSLLTTIMKCVSNEASYCTLLSLQCTKPNSIMAIFMTWTICFINVKKWPPRKS